MRTSLRFVAACSWLAGLCLFLHAAFTQDDCLLHAAEWCMTVTVLIALGTLGRQR